MSYAQTIVLGNIGSIEAKQAKSGMAIVSLSVAVSDRVKKGDTYEDETEWYRATVFGKTAEFVSKYFSKGDSILLVGRMKTRKYEDKSGATKYSTELVVDRASFAGRKGGGGGAQVQDVNPTGAPDDDLPF